MKILFLTNNPKASLSLADWLRSIGEEVIVYSEPLTPLYINNQNLDFVISYNYRYIIKEDIIRLLPNRIINLHISYLPWNRGAHPNVWSFLSNKPKGVTIHLIDKGIDTGAILVQKRVCFCEEKETLESSYQSLQCEIQKLFRDNWDAIKNGSLPIRCPLCKGTYHRSSDIKPLIDTLGATYWSLPIKEVKKITKEYFKHHQN